MARLSSGYEDNRIRLARHLPIPINPPIDLIRISAIDPCLEGIPVDYLRDVLAAVGSQLLQVTTCVTAPSPQVSARMQLVCHDISAEPPTHILACYTNNDPVRPGFLFPVHALVFAINCARLPNFPPSNPPILEEAGTSINIPVVMLRIPSLATFPTLLAYIYTKDTDRLLADILPAHITPEQRQSPVEASESISESHSTAILLDYTRKVHGLWSNALALAVHDDALYGVISAAWEVLLGALSILSAVIIEERNALPVQ